MDSNSIHLFTGHDREEIFTLSYEEICACISKTKVTSYEPILENLQCHENVIESIMKEHTVLPLKFSSICKNKEDIYLLLEKYYSQFKENLKKVEGKVELGVKIFYKLGFENEDKVDKEQCKSPKEYMFRRFDRYIERKKHIESIMAVAEKLHDKLCLIASENSYKKPLRNNLIFNAAYLVEKNKIEEFCKVVDEAKEEYTSYKIINSGLWAPYHFTSIVKEGEVDE
jgi:hypothetical protein